MAQRPTSPRRTKPPKSLTISPADESGEARRGAALDALGVVVDLFRRGHHEPLPLFARLSRALVDERGERTAWDGGFKGSGDVKDRWNRAAFDNASFDQITSLPLRPGDPAGPGNDRALRFASILWGTKAATSTETNGAPQ